jgi:hypothetical protein
VRIWNGWLSIEEGDSATLSLNYNSITELEKHYVGKRRRSFLHYPVDCAFCRRGFPLLQRFTAQVIYEGQNLSWEFGAIVHGQLQALRNEIHESGFIKVRIDREGKGRDTYYQCTFIPNDSPDVEIKRKQPSLADCYCPKCFGVLPAYWSATMLEDRKCKCGRNAAIPKSVDGS